MSGLRTRKYVTLVAMLFGSWSLIHITVNLRRQDVHSRYDEVPSHASDHHSPSSLVLNHGYRKPSSDASSPPVARVSPKDLENIHRPNGHIAQSKGKDPDLPPLDAHIPAPATNLKTDTKYLSYMTYAGLTNQVMIILGFFCTTLILNSFAVRAFFFFFHSHPHATYTLKHTR